MTEARIRLPAMVARTGATPRSAQMVATGGTPHPLVKERRTLLRSVSRRDVAALLDIPKTSPPKVIAGTTTDFRRVILARNGLDARETKERRDGVDFGREAGKAKRDAGLGIKGAVKGGAEVGVLINDRDSSVAVL